jgi:hypothetical protein
MTNRLRVAGLLTVILAIPVLSQDALVYEFELRGAPAASNTRTAITLKMTQGHAYAVLVFSEPSHTPLVAFVDNLNGEPSEQPWFAGLIPPGTPGMFLNLSNGVQGTARGLVAPVGDTYLTVNTLVDHEAGVRTNTVRMNINPRSFGFGIGWERPKETEAATQDGGGPISGGSWITCFEGDGGGCNYAKAYCSQNSGTCCRETQIPGCGWCGRLMVQCGTSPNCNSCPGV